MAQHPLLDLFQRLRNQHNLTLGIDDYLSVVKALQAGFGLESAQALERLCLTLWAKSARESQVISELFRQSRVGEASRPDSLDDSLSEDNLNRPNEARRAPTNPDPDGKNAQPETIESSSYTVAEAVESTDESLETVIAVRREEGQQFFIDIGRSSRVADYLPVTSRQMKQGWRRLRRSTREGPPVDLDVEATVRQACQDGVLAQLMLLPRRINRAELVMFIDRDGSMVPFHALSHVLAETALRGGRLRATSVFYFHDCPTDYVFSDPARLNGRTTSEVLSELGEQVFVLILSDAGAARGKNDIDRYRLTINILDLIEKSARRVVWLNPMPEARWQNTTAERIARHLPMFDMSQKGLQGAINTLRGRYVYSEHSIRGELSPMSNEV